MAEPSTSTVRITEDTKIRLRKIMGKLLAEDGKDHTMEQAIIHLLDYYEKGTKKD